MNERQRRFLIETLEALSYWGSRIGKDKYTVTVTKTEMILMIRELKKGKL